MQPSMLAAGLYLAMAVSLMWTTAATPGVVTLTVYNDTSCSIPYATSMYNLDSFSTPDIGDTPTTTPACVDATNVSAAASNPKWSQIQLTCQVYTSSAAINFRALYFANNTGCDTTAEYYSVSFNQQNSVTMGLCGTGTISIYLNGTTEYAYNTPMRLTCTTPSTSHATRAFPLPQTAATVFALLYIAALTQAYIALEW